MAHEMIDLRGVPCPANTAKALIKMATMDEGEVLEIWLDDGEPMENVPPALKDEGHELLLSQEITGGGWSLKVRVTS